MTDLFLSQIFIRCSNLEKNILLAVTPGPKFTSYTTLHKFGLLYVLDVLIVASSGYVVGDIICTLPVTPKNPAGRYIIGNNGSAMQCSISGNNLVSDSANNNAGTYGGLIIFM